VTAAPRHIFGQKSFLTVVGSNTTTPRNNRITFLQRPRGL
jgi:hypothetical protein